MNANPMNRIKKMLLLALAKNTMTKERSKLKLDKPRNVGL
jgi:hypothetical protein